MARYRALGQAYDETPLKVRGLGAPAGDGARLALLGAEEVGEIRYTLDGSAPSTASPIYGAPLEVKLGATVRARAFRAGQPLAAASTIKVDARMARTRRSQELKSCGEGILLNLEDDAPLRGERAKFLIDLMAPCWIYQSADLSGVSKIEVVVGQLPFNFQIGKDIEKIVFRPPATPQGELEVRQGSCEGPVVAVLPLASAAKSQGVTVLTGEIRGEGGQRDLCFTFTQQAVEPMWALDRVTLVAETPRGR